MKDLRLCVNEGNGHALARKRRLSETTKPVPRRPLGYFEDCYDEASVQEENQLAGFSVREVVD
jgi:hypothetical protein